MRPRSGRFGAVSSWFRSFVVAWLVVIVAAAGLAQVDLEMSAGVGIVVLVAVTAAVHALVWRARPAAADSGWRAAAKLAVPGLIDRRVVARSQQSGASPLTGLRAVFLSFVAAVVLIGVVVPVVADGLGDDSAVSPVVTTAVVAAVAAAGLLGGRRIGRRLDCTSIETLLGAYRSRFFVQIALSELGALVGFVGFIVASRPGIYFLGAAFTLVGFAHAAPTRANLAKDDAGLEAAGCPHRLQDLLARPTSSGGDQPAAP